MLHGCYLSRHLADKVETLGGELARAWLERSMDNHWGETKYMRVVAEKLQHASEFLPHKMIIVSKGLSPTVQLLTIA